MKATCPVCMHHCTIAEGKTGICGARTNQGGQIVCSNYGKITSYALDPIEKKPLRHFYPGSKILSVGSYGCNLSCSFCQNYKISAIKEAEAEYEILSPDDLIREALALRDQGNIGIAYTYNEPLIGYEYVRDCAKLAHENGLKNVVVTNGCVEPEILEAVLPYVDAFNVDLKGFTDRFYERQAGSLHLTKGFIEKAVTKSHVEVTTLVIPGENDRLEEIEEAAQWLAFLNTELPYHISRFFPQWKMADREPTDVKVIYALAEAARKYLKYVYTGNC